MSSAFNIPDGYAPALPQRLTAEAIWELYYKSHVPGERPVQGVDKMGDEVTLWEPTEHFAPLHFARHIENAIREQIVAAPTPPVDAVPGEPVATVTNIGMLRATPHGIKTLKAGDKLYAASVASGSEPVTIPERNALLRLLVAEVTRLQTLFTDALGDTQQDSAPIAPAAAAGPSEPVLVMDDDELQDFCISLSFDQDDYTVDVIRNVERRMLGQPLFQCSVMSNAEMDAAPPSATAQAAPQTTAASTQALGEAGEAGEVKP